MQKKIQINSIHYKSFYIVATIKMMKSEQRNIKCRL